MGVGSPTGREYVYTNSWFTAETKNIIIILQFKKSPKRKFLTCKNSFSHPVLQKSTSCMKWGPLGFPGTQTPLSMPGGGEGPRLQVPLLSGCPPPPASFCNHYQHFQHFWAPLAWSSPGREPGTGRPQGTLGSKTQPLWAEDWGLHFAFASTLGWSSGLVPRRTYCSNLAGRPQKWVKQQSSEWVWRWAPHPHPCQMTSATHRTKGASRAFSCWTTKSPSPFPEPLFTQI